jgi:phosphoribosyl 1,2-cyclic phosphodiesterase
MRNRLSFTKIKAVFITHEHFDHTRGVEVIARKYQIPVYVSKATLGNSRIKLDEKLVNDFTAYTPVIIGNLAVNAFPKLHDAKDPHSFTVTCNGITVGVLTDVGSACEHVVKNFKQCHAIFLEANYDDEMLENGSYPEYLKNRIKSDIGHLSNHQALELFTTHRPDFMSHVLLSHLSKDNNNPRVAQQLFMRHAAGTKIVVASRNQESPVFHITGEKVDHHSTTKVNPSPNYIQPTLF